MALVSTGVAAAELHVDPSTIHDWMRRGLITPTATTPGGHHRWDLDEIRAAIEQSRLGDVHVPEPPPVVAGIVTSRLGVLIGRRNDRTPLWTFIAGQIEPGESPADAIVREVKEEACLVVEPADQELGRRVHPATRRTMIYVACRPVGDLHIEVGDPDELAEVRWVDLAEATQFLPGMFEPVAAFLGRTIR
jgi:8-oxo-dGTP pyrophosphatase MutT (NUDIX family)